MTPTFSVIIPTRDRTDLLALCLDRLAPGKQSLSAERYEVVVSDDSVSASAREFIGTRYPWARWSAGPRRGPAANRNAGVATAVGDIFVFLDDDCLPERDLLRAYLDAMRDDVGVYEGRITCHEGITSPMQTAPVNLEGGALWSCNVALRRGAFMRVGGFDARFPLPHMEDVDLRERLLAAGVAIQFVPEASVDHPPRRLPWGARLARMHQATVLFMALHPPERGLLWFLQNTLRARVSFIRRRELSWDSFVSLWSIPFELAAIIIRWRGWKAWTRSVVER
jgi:GT2 family glycosyltransferase